MLGRARISHRPPAAGERVHDGGARRRGSLRPGGGIERKFRPWRRRAITNQLALVTAASTPDPRPTLQTRRTALIEALATRDESYSGEYFELALVRRYQAILLVIALIDRHSRSIACR